MLYIIITRRRRCIGLALANAISTARRICV